MRGWRHKRRCRRLASQCNQVVLKRYLENCAGLEINDIQNTPLISVDLELTGLDARLNQIISIGWTLIDQGRIQVGANRHLLICAEQSVGSSAAIHELMDSEVAGGVELETGLELLFDAAVGRVWVFHHSVLDVAFLQRAAMGWAGIVPPFVVLDTMQIELAQRKRREIPVLQGDLKLNRLRGDYHLPRYTAHDALIDAFATAELLLAIAARMDGKKSLALKPHLKFF